MPASVTGDIRPACRCVCQFRGSRIAFQLVAAGRHRVGARCNRLALAPVSASPTETLFQRLINDITSVSNDTRNVLAIFLYFYTLLDETAINH